MLTILCSSTIHLNFPLTWGAYLSSKLFLFLSSRCSLETRSVFDIMGQTLSVLGSKYNNLEFIHNEELEIMGSCPLDILFSKNVPHILEKIFLSLDYESFKSCLRVSNAWREQLTSELLKRKAKKVFRREIRIDGCFLWQYIFLTWEDWDGKTTPLMWPAGC